MDRNAPWIKKELSLLQNYDDPVTEMLNKMANVTKELETFSAMSSQPKLHEKFTNFIDSSGSELDRIW